MEQVVAGVLTDAAGRVLIARRPEHKSQGGLWEFPGGKIVADETQVEALQRELMEELGVNTRDFSPLIRVPYRYPAKTIILHVFRVGRYDGTPAGRDGQQLQWVRKEDLSGVDLLPADRAVAGALQLPRTYLITPEPQADRAVFLNGLERSLDAGVQLVQLRAPALKDSEYLELAAQVAARCRRFGARLLLNASPAALESVDADGIHLNSRRLHEIDERPVGRRYWLAASCHTEADVLRANRIGADLVVVSPVLTTASHPNAQPLGWAGFEALAAQSSAPVYALGGMGIEHLPEALARGAQGIAAITALWRHAF